MAQVSVNQLRKRFGQVTAVDDVSFALDDGHCAVVVGPSGCGKTTLLRLIAGLETPETGSILIGGRDVTHSAPAKRDVAMLFQDFALYPHMRIRRNLAFAATLGNESKDVIQARLEKIAALLGIEELLDRKPGELSGGQRQRAAVGRVLMRQPNIALYDEPLSNLDANLRVQLRAELKSLQRRFATTTIFVTHDQEEAMSLADLLIVMADGTIQQIGSPAEVYQNPANRFVAGFLGSPAMNFVDGVLEHAGDSCTFTDRRDFALSLDCTIAAAGASSDAVLGVRPEALSLHGPGEPITMRVEMNQCVGGSYLVRGETESGVVITARLSSPLEIGGQVGLHVQLGAIHMFEPGAFGKALGRYDVAHAR